MAEILEGEAHPRARLTAAKVVAMRQAARAGGTVAECMAIGGVSHTAAFYAITGATWKSVDALEAPVPKVRRVLPVKPRCYHCGRVVPASGVHACPMGRAVG